MNLKISHYFAFFTIFAGFIFPRSILNVNHLFSLIFSIPILWIPFILIFMNMIWRVLSGEWIGENLYGYTIIITILSHSIRVLPLYLNVILFVLSIIATRFLTDDFSLMSLMEIFDVKNNRK